jgi:DNA polymerase-1
VRNFQERAAINAPIQGSASELMRLAMMRLNYKLSEYRDENIKILLQIHDELIFEVKSSSVKEMSKIITEVMNGVESSEHHKFTVPLSVDLNFGENWGMLH